MDSASKAASWMAAMRVACPTTSTKLQTVIASPNPATARRIGVGLSFKRQNPLLFLSRDAIVSDRHNWKASAYPLKFIVNYAH